MNVEAAVISPSDVPRKRRLRGGLIVISGIPGSGKTTIALEEQKRLRSEGYKVVRVNRDDIRSQIFGEEYHDAPPVPWCENDVNKLQLKLIDHYLREEFIVILDATNLNYRDVKAYVEIAEELELKVEHIAVVVPLEVAIERNAKRGASGGRFVPEEAIERMWKRQTNVLAAPSQRFPADRTIGA